MKNQDIKLEFEHCSKGRLQEIKSGTKDIIID